MSQFGAISYSAVAFLYTLLAVLLLTSWRRRPLGGYLIAACVMNTVWAGYLAAQSSGTAISTIVWFCLEVLRTGAWLTFLAVLLANLGAATWIRRLIHLCWLGCLFAGIVVWLQPGILPPDINILTIALPGGLFLALIGLMLIEQLFRNTGYEARWAIKPLVLGLGGLFAYDLFLYSQGVLFNALDTTSWFARGAVNVFFVPLIAISVRRNPHWELDIFVSRHVVFYSTTLIAVGAYLLLVSLGGYALVLYGGNWGQLLQVIFVVGAVLVLVALLFSPTIRARSKVFLSKHFFRNKYDYRDEWLRLISTISSFEDSSTRQIVIKAMGQIVASPGGLLWTIDDREDAYELVATYGSTALVTSISVDSSIVTFINKTGWLIDLREYAEDRALYDGLELPPWLQSAGNAWLIVPLMYRHKLIGLVLLDKAPGTPRLNYEDRDLLKTAGNHLAVHLVQEKSDNQLAEARQFETYNKLTAFLMHDLNNLIAQQSLIIRNAEKHRRNPQFIDDAIETIANSVERMNRVMDQLKRRGTDRPGKRADVATAVAGAIDRCNSGTPKPTMEVVDQSVALPVDAEEFTMVLAHLVRNAQDATPGDGTVEIRATVNGGELRIVVEDSGCGMSDEFIRQSLFKPFESTKGSQGMGIGAYQAREFARKSGGDLVVESEPGRGTVVTMTLPVPQF